MNDINDIVFGADSLGDTAEQRARSSKRMFVRGQDQIALWSGEATGRKLSAWEAYQSFGVDLLYEAVTENVAPLVFDSKEPAQTLRNRRLQLGLTVADLKQFTGISEEEIEDAEDHTTRTEIRVLENLAKSLGLDERLLTHVSGAGGDTDLAVRLRSQLNTGLSAMAVCGLDEAVWVGQAQERLRNWLGIKATHADRFTPNDNYGDAGYHAWRQGFYLAQQARELLGIDPTEPVDLRDICDQMLGVPLITTTLPSRVAGATMFNGTHRCIVINDQGSNSNVWIRRMTIAHELGHLLWDPDEKLKSLRVDEYEFVESDVERDGGDYVEQRANAFAVEFLAPQKEAVEVFGSHGDTGEGIRAVMERFGISFTAARFHVWNGMDRAFKLESIRANTEPDDAWMGKEAFTAVFFPIESTPISRRGAFAGFVVQAQIDGIITVDTATQYLQCSLDEYDNNAEMIKELC